MNDEPRKRVVEPISARVQRWMERKLGQRRLPLPEFNPSLDKALRKAWRERKRGSTT